MAEKFCKLCLNYIRDYDDYVKITDYNKGKKHSEGFYHITCYKEKVLNKKQIPLPKEMEQMMKKANAMMTQVTGIKEVVNLDGR